MYPPGHPSNAFIHLNHFLHLDLIHPPLISKEEWREAKNRISMPDREAVILEEITGEGILSSLHPILFKEDIDV